MRELTKAMMRFGWAMPLFAIRQMANLASPKEWTRPGRATAAFDALSSAASSQMGESLREVYDLGNRVQRGTVDLLFGGLDGGCGGNRTTTAASGATAGASAGSSPPAGNPAASAQGSQGWGPVPAGS